MPLDFNALKNNRQDSLKKLTSQLEKFSSNSNQKSNDDRFWYPNVDKAGNGSALIRFLPAAPGEDMPFVRVFSHGFKGPHGNWYIEDSLTTIGKEDPVSEYNNKLWNNGTEAGKEQARAQKRKLTFIANVLIIKDLQNPENDGTVRLYRFGKKLFDKINDVMHPDELDDSAPLNPFDFWDGATFKLKIRNVEGYRNYDKSEFDKPSPLSKDDEELKRIWKSQHSLEQFIAPEAFKSYDELKTKLNKVLGLDGVDPKPLKSTAEDIGDEVPWVDEDTTPAPKGKTKAAPAAAVVDDDDDDKFFQDLIRDDT